MVGCFSGAGLVRAVGFELGQVGGANLKNICANDLVDIIHYVPMHRNYGSTGSNGVVTIGVVVKG